MKQILWLSLLVGCLFYGALHGTAPSGQDPGPVPTPTVQEGIEEETMTMELSTGAGLLMEHLGCGARTAASLERTLLDAGIPALAQIAKIEDGVYQVLEVRDDASNAYYVWVARGYFVEEIRVGSLDGPQLYHAME